MSHHEIPEMDTRGLCRFGLMLGGVLALVFGVLLPWRFDLDQSPNLWWIGGGVLVALWALAAPDSLRGLYMVWMRMAMKISHVVNVLILSVVYFLVIAPMGLIMRAMGRDPMRRRLEPKAESYRVASKPAPRNHVERPF